MENKKSKESLVYWGTLAIIALVVIFYYAIGFNLSGEGIWESIVSFKWIFDALLLFLLALAISKIVTKFVGMQFKKIAESKAIRIDKTKISIVQSLTTATIYLIAFIVIVNTVPELRNFSLSLLAGVGFMAIIVGFAAQETLSNIIAGILIGVFRPFRVGDRIEVQGTRGKVENITLRHTVMKTWENKRLVIPNAVISKETITNYSLGDETQHGDETMLMSVEMGISYDSNLDKAKKIMIDEARKHKDFFRPKKESSIMTKNEAVKVRLIGFGESSQDLKLYFWTKDYPTGFKMACDLRESIKKKFDKSGIEIPFPYRTLVYKKDLKKNK